MKFKIKIMDGGGAAWRARYVYVNGDKVAHLGIDPDGGRRPALFGSLAGKEFRVNLPTVPWKYPSSALYLRAHKLSSEFWHGLDGRFGWGTEAWRKS